MRKIKYNRVFPNFSLVFPNYMGIYFSFSAAGDKRERPGGSFGRNGTKCSDWKKWVGFSGMKWKKRGTGLRRKYLYNNIYGKIFYLYFFKDQNYLLE